MYARVLVERYTLVARRNRVYVCVCTHPIPGGIITCLPVCCEYRIARIMRFRWVLLSPVFLLTFTLDSDGFVPLLPRKIDSV